MEEERPQPEWDPYNEGSEFVYFIQAIDGGPVKIGTSNCPPQRLAQLQVGYPQELRLLGVLVGGIRLEGVLHNQCGDARVRGEWYDASHPAVQEVLTTIREWPSHLDFVPAYARYRVGVPEAQIARDSKRLEDWTNKSLGSMSRWRVSDGVERHVEIHHEDPGLMRLKAAIERQRKAA